MNSLNATININFAGYRNASEQSDGCLRSKEQIQTVSGMQASICPAKATYFRCSLCEPLPSPAESAHTVPVLHMKVRHHVCLRPVSSCHFCNKLAGIRGSSLACSVECFKTGQARSSLQSQLPGRKGRLIGALHAKEVLWDVVRKLMIFKIAEHLLTARATGRKSCDHLCNSHLLSPTGYSGIYAFTLRSCKL